MINLKAAKLRLAIACAVGAVGFPGIVCAAEGDLVGQDASNATVSPVSTNESLMFHTLTGITIEGEQDTMPGGMLNTTAQMGLLGEQDVMDMPFSVTNVNREALDYFTSPYYGFAEALSLASPSARPHNGGNTTNITIRGIWTSGHSYYLNGVPGMLYSGYIPSYWVDSVSLVSGPNIGVNGTSYSEAVSGTVNFKSKVASEEGDNEVKLTYRGGSSVEEGIDIGRRFGDNSEYGIRVTATNIDGETAIKGYELEQQNIFVNFDHEDEKSKTNLFMGYNNIKLNGSPGTINFSTAVTKLPSAPDSSRIYKPDWNYVEYDSWIAVLNHEQKFSEKVSAYINAGIHREDYKGFISGSPTVINNEGDFTITATQYPFIMTKKYVGAGLKGTFYVGEVRNDWTIGMDKTWYTNAGNSANPDWSWTGTGNLYQPNSWEQPSWTNYRPPHSYDAQLTGWHILDTIKALDEKLQVTVGVHGHEYKRRPVGSEGQDSDAVCPTYAISYKFTPELMVYASHTESFGYGTLVGSTYANAGEMLDPAKTKQNEFGVKFKTGKFFNTFNIFEIDQANTVEQWEGGDLYLRLNGRQKNKGVEWGFTGNIGRKWDLIGGLMYLDSKDDDGKRINGAVRWSGNLGLIYHPNDKLALIGSATYMGTASVNDGALDVPSYFKFDLGVSYTTQLNQTPVTITAMCYNVADKDYWQASGGYSSLYLGEPRTFVVSAAFRL